MKNIKVLIVATNHSDFENPKAAPTGLWLSELVHAYNEFDKEGWEIEIVSPKGGKVPVDERSLGRMVLDKHTKARYEDKTFMSLLENTKSVAQVDGGQYDLIFFAGGHGAMWDFANDPQILELTKSMYEAGKVVSTVCHGAAVLQNVKLSNGDYMIKNKRGTGFPYFDEGISGVKKLVPYNLQQRLKDRGMKYSKAFFPLGKHVVVDGNLVTGQNPASTTKTSLEAIKLIKNK